MSNLYLRAVALFACLSLSAAASVADDGNPNVADKNAGEKTPAAAAPAIAAPAVADGAQAVTSDPRVRVIAAHGQPGRPAESESGFRVATDRLDSPEWRAAVDLALKVQAGKGEYFLLRVVLDDGRPGDSVKARTTGRFRGLAEKGKNSGRQQDAISSGEFVFAERIGFVAGKGRDLNVRETIVLDGYGYGPVIVNVDVPPKDTVGVVGDVVLLRHAERPGTLAIRFVAESGINCSKVVVVGGPFGKTLAFDTEGDLTVPLERGVYQVFFPDFDLRQVQPTIAISPGLVTQLTCNAFSQDMLQYSVQMQNPVVPRPIQNRAATAPGFAATAATAVGNAIRSAFTVPPKPLAKWGTLKGRFIYDGKPPEPKKIAAAGKPHVLDENLIVGNGGGLANVVVFLRTKNAAEHPDYRKTTTDAVVLKMQNSRFEPHVTLLRTTQTLKLENADADGNNVNCQTMMNPPFNPLLKAGTTFTLKLDKEEPLPAKCSSNIHPWMSGWIVVRESPYMAVTDKDGSFTIKNLPLDGELEFQVWQESCGFLKNVAFTVGSTDPKGRFKLALKPGDNDLGEIKVPPRLFQK